MKARLVNDGSDTMMLLCSDGSICTISDTDLSCLLSHFKNVEEFSGNDGSWLSTCKDMALYPGETLAYVSDDLSLVIMDPRVLCGITSTDSILGPYIDLADYAKKANRSRQIIKVYCREGRLLGAKKIGGSWMIPENAPYPVPPSRRHNRS